MKNEFSTIKNRICSILTGIILMLFLIWAPVSTITSFSETSWPVMQEEISAEGAILIDADSGLMLYGKNEHEQYYPASITKVLTAVIVLENVDDLDEMVEFSVSATVTNLEPNSTIIAATAGDRLSVRDCLYSLLLHSANDCANALAEHVAGSNEAFAELMNEKAAEIGCTDSHFKNPSGLNDPEHYTSAADMAKIMQYAISNETFRQIDAVQAYTHAPISRYPDPEATENTVYAHHRMMRRTFREYYDGVFAGKTGYTTLAGNTLVTAAERDGLTLIAVILNGHNTQYSDTKKLFDFGFSNFESVSPGKQDQVYTAIHNDFKVTGISLVDMLEFSIDENQRVILPKGENLEAASSALSYDLTDAERNGGVFARVNYQYAGQDIGHVYIRMTDQSEVREEQQKDADLMEQRALETISESTRQSEKDDALTAEGQNLQESSENRAPIVLDRENGRIQIQKPILRVLMVLAVISVLVLLGLGIWYVLERREAFVRERRRKRMLRHTRDLTRAQKAKRDLMLGNKKNRRRR